MEEAAAGSTRRTTGSEDVMERQPVTSSMLASVGYDEASAALEVEFVEGGVYQYFGVPSHVHAGLMAANSHGTYFDTHVKKAGYQYAKVG